MKQQSRLSKATFTAKAACHAHLSLSVRFSGANCCDIVFWDLETDTTTTFGITSSHLDK